MFLSWIKVGLFIDLAPQEIFLFVLYGHVVFERKEAAERSGREENSLM